MPGRRRRRRRKRPLLEHRLLWQLLCLLLLLASSSTLLRSSSGMEAEKDNESHSKSLKDFDLNLTAWNFHFEMSFTIEYGVNYFKNLKRFVGDNIRVHKLSSAS